MYFSFLELIIILGKNNFNYNYNNIDLNYQKTKMIDVLSASQILIIDIIFSVFSLISLLSALIMTIDILIRIGKKIQESNRANMDTSREPLLKGDNLKRNKTS